MTTSCCSASVPSWSTCCSMKWKVQWLLHLLQYEMKGTVTVVAAAVWNERYSDCCIDLLQYEMKGTVICCTCCSMKWKVQWLLHLLQYEIKGTVIVVPGAVWNERYSDCCTCCRMKWKVQWLLYPVQYEMKGMVTISIADKGLPTYILLSII